MPNSSEKNAACGLYIAPCRTRPTVTARIALPPEPRSSSAKNANAHTPVPTAPNRYTARRPMTSDSHPHTGIVTRCTADPTRTAFNPIERDTSTWFVRYTRTNAVMM
ncbi:hypothetical protein BJF85_14725 [Saccharomonospora sp. CUA-673]|nr:hypothetical protein BJF85_14725 [Saccharomonospora sp. CUA-673]